MKTPHRLALALVPVVLTALLYLPVVVAAGVTPPNIVVIVADDLGYADLGFLERCPADVRAMGTPGLDALARTGTYFSNAYSTSPICSPSRCGLITGRYQQRWGNYWYGQGGLPNEETTLPQLLQAAGYFTKKVGKTHLNGGPAQHPLDHGFEESIGFIHHTWDYIRLSQADLDAYKKRAAGKSLGILCVGPLERGRGGTASYDEGFTTEIFTDETVKTIRAGANSERPFFVELEYNAVHMPTYITHPDYAKRAGFDQPVWDREAAEWSFPFWDPNKSTWKVWHKNWGHLGEVDPLGRKRYLANLKALDDGIVRILETLEATGQREDTIVVFLSDNGGTINTYANNTPLRGFKYMFGEGGVRIPLLVSWPGQLPSGQRRNELVSAMDVMPTMLELANLARPDNLDGRSLAPSLRDPRFAAGHDHLCWADGKGTWSVRQGPWKLIQSKGWDHSAYQLDADNIARPAENITYPKGLLLYHLGEDIGETTDRSAEHPECVAAMKTLYETWRGKMGTPRRAKKN